MLDKKVYETWNDFNSDFINGRIGIITYNGLNLKEFNKATILLVRHNISFKIEWKEDMPRRVALLVHRYILKDTDLDVVYLENLKIKEFTKADLIPGKNIVLLKNGNCCHVGITNKDKIYFMTDTWKRGIDDYTYNLLLQDADEFSVDKVYELKEPKSFYGSFDKNNLILVWEREQEVKELSVEQISKLLGYKVKVVE
ncbi:hypothetical protein [uncultured Thomasclavelia sp.]|uniref:hypothetical protein n=1 Tax=uncultured Thomasclavelia sp. TaxID=3025759 RepID=UPI002628BCE7|nr:hypothetical protein [uncultured Thomasclavelia sp.]